MRRSKWRHSFHIWVRYPFKIALMHIPLCWLADRAYSDHIVVFPLSFTFSSHTIPLTQSQPLRKSDAMLASHITQLFIQLETKTVRHNEHRIRQKKTNHTHDLLPHHTHLQHTYKALRVTLTLCRSSSSFSQVTRPVQTQEPPRVLCYASSHSFTLSLSDCWLIIQGF